MQSKEPQPPTKEGRETEYKNAWKNKLTMLFSTVNPHCQTIQST